MTWFSYVTLGVTTVSNAMITAHPSAPKHSLLTSPLCASTQGGRTFVLACTATNKAASKMKGEQHQPRTDKATILQGTPRREMTLVTFDSKTVSRGWH